MTIVKDTFGLSRVIEPKGSVPVTAWKVDNSREIGPEEGRVKIKKIHLERDNFQQLCSECGFDEAKIIAKILEVVNRRGKLHNPFTNSAGQFFGTIEALGDECEKNTDFKVGDEVLCMTTMTAHPIFIESIQEIDYNYGQLTVTGYGIIFSDTPLAVIPSDLKLNYTIATFDEAGSLYSIFQEAKKEGRFLVIGKDMVSCIMYIGAIRKSVGDDGYIAVIMDDDAIGVLEKKQAVKELKRLANAAYVLDITQPIEAAENILKDETLFDMSINCEDLTGAGVLGVLLTRPRGELYFTSIKNSNTQSILVAESMGKELETYELGQFFKNYETFTMDLIRFVREDLDRIDAMFEQQAKITSQPKRKVLNTSIDKTGKADDFIFSSPVTEAMVDEALNIADYDCNVILQGETGVGKEKVLGLIHKNSARKGKPCIKINCATIQENLAESEFFGYEAGSFTGAQSTGKQGYFELANGGILFLDEVGTLSLNLQSKLLRVLQENQFYRVGGTTPINVNVRVICANNIPLRQLVEEGKFREDLYYRLNICTITVPPLRDRIDEVPTLAQAFLENYCKRYGADKELDTSALIRLAEHDWPGNVRELENVIHRTVISVRDHIITRDDIDRVLNESLYEDLVINLKRNMRTASSLDFNKIVEQQEIQLIEYALKKCGSTRKAAEFLNMTQPQLMRKKKKYNIADNEKKEMK